MRVVTVRGGVGNALVNTSLMRQKLSTQKLTTSLLSPTALQRAAANTLAQGEQQTLQMPLPPGVPGATPLGPSPLPQAEPIVTQVGPSSSPDGQRQFSEVLASVPAWAWAVGGFGVGLVVLRILR